MIYGVYWRKHAFIKIALLAFFWIVSPLAILDSCAVCRVSPTVYPWNPKRTVSNDVSFPTVIIAIMAKNYPLGWGLAILGLFVVQLVQQTAASTAFFACTLIGGAAAWDPPVYSPISIDTHAAAIFYGAHVAAVGGEQGTGIIGALKDLFMVRDGRIVPRTQTQRASFSPTRCIGVYGRRMLLQYVTKKNTICGPEKRTVLYCSLFCRKRS